MLRQASSRLVRPQHLRSIPQQIARPYSVPSAGLLRISRSPRWRGKRAWPANSFGIHNVPAIRHASFARVIPQLAMKLFRVPAMLGAVTVSGLAYIQYQAAQAGTWAIDIFGRAKDSATTSANTVIDGAGNLYERIGTGWRRTVDQVEMPEWMRGIMEAKSEESSGGGGVGPEPKESRAGPAAAGAATAAAFALDEEGAEDQRSEDTAARDDQMMMLTRKMIEIRSLLQTVGQSETLTLPSIVVIGSQSSGKSSVLEAIVGHEFLPKGSNMVTRRPIELTLVNSPKATSEYGEFPTLGLGKITDFSQIQKTLTDLNLAVPEQQCVSDDPIQLRIYSPHVPDLSLIDLPGYIQVVSEGQPPELKEKISQLCDKYIQPPNVILAISAADVDLANSTSLRASRRVDPRGERTIGVITKMDLVDAARGASILTDKNYPLRLGYVGVICRLPPTSSSLFSRGSAPLTAALTKHEATYFKSHPEFSSQNLTVGTPSLRRVLMRTLEASMSASLSTTARHIRTELDEATYEFKVQYNERPLSAETYLAESVDAFKHDFRSFAESFGRTEVLALLKQELDQQVLNLLAQRYWNRPVESLEPDMLGQGDAVEKLAKIPSTTTTAKAKGGSTDDEAELYRIKLDASVASLTKLGIGRLASTVVATALSEQIGAIVAQSSFASSPFARGAIQDAAAGILRELSYDTSDELEICLKPYKFRIDLSEADWSRGRENIAVVLKGELRDCEGALRGVEEGMGGKRKAKDVVAFIDKVRKGEVALEGTNVSSGAGGFSAELLRRGREAVFLRDRAEVLRLRIKAVSSRGCKSKDEKYACPEVFLDAVAGKLAETSELFLGAELVGKFEWLFPRELDAKFRALTPQQLEQFAREDPKVRRHLDVVRRKELLERVLMEMEALKALEQAEGRRRRADRSDGEGKGRRGWKLFQ
ncbi:putative dynamin family protein [Elsinoe australis]|uniref:dynamin GTPase n=1 Tax=Elsinoe australis TaxID=40998 RepID=A0A4U7B576_9PEZI|nr:putative dynamin family protein [Elsinoe australis]